MKPILCLSIIALLSSCGNSNDNSSTKIAKEPISQSQLQYQKLTFKSLNSFRLLKKMTPSPFDIDVVTETEEEKNEYINNQIPEEVKSLDQKNIEIIAYAFPVKLDKELTSAIVLMSVAPNCCYGDVLKLNDLIYVEITNPKVRIRENQLVKILGKLTVKTKILENQTSRFMYWIKADAITVESK
jgi:hypothetical protein